MTPPVQPVEDPMLRLQYYKETGQSDEAQHYEQYLRETGQLRAPAANGLHREYASGQLAKRMSAANEADQTDAEEPGYLSRFATHVLNTGQGIPGVEAVEAGAGALGSKLTDHPMDYGQSLATLRGATGNIGGATSAGEHLAGSLATLPFLPKSPTTAGALLGGADQLLAADPMSAGERAGRTAVGAGVGGVLGKALDLGVTAGRGLLANDAPRNLLDRIAERSASAKQLYNKALTEGQGKAPTQAVLDFLAQPDIAPIVSGLQETRAFKGVAAHAPEMLDAVYKTLSDQATTVKKGLEAVAPGKPNLGRFRAKDIAAAQSDALDAISGGTVPGPMPGYRPAVKDFAARSADINAVQRGVDALRVAQRTTLPSGKNMTRVTPEAFAQWAKTASPSEIAAAKEGILGGLKGSPKVMWAKLLGIPIVPHPSRTLNAAGGLLRAADPGDAGAQLAKYGLLMANAPM